LGISERKNLGGCTSWSTKSSNRIDRWWRCEHKALHIGRLLVIKAQSFAKISEVTAAAREEYSDNED
jgi:hypothetical protein